MYQPQPPKSNDWWWGMVFMPNCLFISLSVHKLMSCLYKVQSSYLVYIVLTWRTFRWHWHLPPYDLDPMTWILDGLIYLHKQWSFEKTLCLYKLWPWPSWVLDLCCLHDNTTTTNNKTGIFVCFDKLGCCFVFFLCPKLMWHLCIFLIHWYRVGMNEM